MSWNSQLTLASPLRRRVPPQQVGNCIASVRKRAITRTPDPGQPSELVLVGDRAHFLRQRTELPRSVRAFLSGGGTLLGHLRDPFDRLRNRGAGRTEK